MSPGRRYRYESDDDFINRVANCLNDELEQLTDLVGISRVYKYQDLNDRELLQNRLTEGVLSKVYMPHNSRTVEGYTYRQDISHNYILKENITLMLSTLRTGKMFDSVQMESWFTMVGLSILDIMELPFNKWITIRDLMLYQKAIYDREQNHQNELKRKELEKHQK